MVDLSTRRLILKHLTSGDAHDILEMRGDPEVMAFWDWPPDASPADAEAAVEHMLRDVASGGAFYWTARLRSDASFVGLCDLSDVQAHESADIGFMFARSRWGLGLAHEAVSSVLEHARALGLKSVHARIHSQNTRSARLLERTGFRVIETIPAFEIRPGVHRGCTRFDLAL